MPKLVNRHDRVGLIFPFFYTLRCTSIYFHIYCYLFLKELLEGERNLVFGTWEMAGCFRLSFKLQACVSTPKCYCLKERHNTHGMRKRHWVIHSGTWQSLCEILSVIKMRIFLIVSIPRTKWLQEVFWCFFSFALQATIWANKGRSISHRMRLQPLQIWLLIWGLLHPIQPKDSYNS